jgi:alpha-D-xyloside xylohydrolase
MPRAPVVDDLYTRRLESRAVDRSHVRECEVAELSGGTLVLRTRAEIRPGAAWHEAARADDLASLLPREGAAGTLRLEVVADDVLRVRYAESDAVPDGPSPMLAGAPPPPAGVGHERGDDRVVLCTPAARFEVLLRPFVVRARDAAGALLAEVGGPEKNHFQVWDAYNTGICRTPDGRPLAVESFSLRPDEAIFGFGEQFLPLDKVGQTVDLVMVEAIGTTTPRAYKNVPFFWSTRGWGVFLHHSARITCWVGSRAAADVQVAVEDDFLDWFLILGEPKHVLARYTELTGKPKTPPRWSFGLWQSRISYRSADESLDVVRRTREAGVPLDVLHLDTHWFREDWRCDLEFDPERFPDPAGFHRELANLGVQVSLWQLPYIPEGSKLFDELAAADGFVKTRDGGLYDVGICYTPGFRGRVGCIDFTSPAAVRVYQSHLRRLFEAGARVIKADFGEQAPLDGVYADGTPGHRAHNLYPLLYNRAVAEVTEAATGDTILWARSAWAGSQRWPLHWGGDSSANWHNLVPQLRGGLSLGLSGFPFWSMDIGGFFGEARGPLLVRWLQAGMFLSHSRIHGTGDRELYKLDPETLAICRDYVRLRYRLLPYITASARDCAARSLPMMRALALEWPGDPSTWAIGDQWLFGESLLVAPVFDPSGRRRVYLPEGTWTDWWTGERTAGPRWLDVEAELATLPLWLREGAIVPLGPVMEHVDQRPTEALTLRVAPFAGDGETRLAVPVGPAEDLPLRYTARGTAHRVHAPASSVRLEVDVAGRGAPDVELVRER